MAKLYGEYENNKLGIEYLDFVTDVKTILNYGKYASQVVGAAPSWTGQEGEEVWRFITNGTGGIFAKYLWLNTGWNWMAWTNTGGVGGLSAVVN